MEYTSILNTMLYSLCIRLIIEMPDILVTVTFGTKKIMFLYKKNGKVSFIFPSLIMSSRKGNVLFILHDSLK